MRVYVCDRVCVCVCVCVCARAHVCMHLDSMTSTLRYLNMSVNDMSADLLRFDRKLSTTSSTALITAWSCGIMVAEA